MPFMIRSTLFLLAVFTLVVRPAHAAERDAAAAEVLFQKGRDAMKAGDYEAACESFAESRRLDPAVGTVMNLATCQEKLGNLANAWEHWQHALGLLPENDPRRAFAQERVDELEGQLPRLIIVAGPGAPANMVVERDGIQLGRASLGEPLPVDPGEHVVIARSPRHAARQYRISVELGSTESLRVVPGAELPEPPPTDRQRVRNSQRMWSYLAAGVGVAGFATAGVTAALLPQAKQELDQECPNGACSPTGMEALDRTNRLLTLNTVGFIVGGVGLATGTVLFVTSPSAKEPPKAEDKAVPRTAAGIGFLPGGATLGIEGTF